MYVEIGIAGANPTKATVATPDRQRG